MIDLQIGMIGVFAFAGDLSMGQPSSHSPRTALLSTKLADNIGCTAVMRRDALQLALLRWSGCTANADEFEHLFGDDVAGRAALIAGQDPFINKRAPTASISSVIDSLAAMHCETGIEITQRLQLGGATLSRAFLDLFEHWDGSGNPKNKKGDDIETAAQLVSIAGDLEVWSRVHGLHKALLMLEETAGSHHDPRLVGTVIQQAPGWLSALEEIDAWAEAALEVGSGTTFDVDLDALAYLLADYVDLKIPSLGRLSRLTSQMAMKAVDGEDAVDLKRASLIYTLGFVSVPNRVLTGSQFASGSVDEAIRIIPHWTERMLSRCPQFKGASTIAGSAFERLDGSGFHRGLTQKHFNANCRLLQAASLASILIGKSSDDGQAKEKIAEALLEGVKRGSLDANAVEKITPQLGLNSAGLKLIDRPGLEVSPRETEVLDLLSKGQSNKQIARTLGISASTVGTHVESIYRKLGVSNRATATLKALEEGLLV